MDKKPIPVIEMGNEDDESYKLSDNYEQLCKGGVGHVTLTCNPPSSKSPEELAAEACEVINAQYKEQVQTDAAINELSLTHDSKVKKVSFQITPKKD